MVIGSANIPKQGEGTDPFIWYKILAGGALEARVYRLAFNRKLIPSKRISAPDANPIDLSWVDSGAIPADEFILWDGVEVPDENLINPAEIYKFTVLEDPAEYANQTAALAELFTRFSGLGDLYLPGPKPDPYLMRINGTNYTAGTLTCMNVGSVRAGVSIEGDSLYRFLYEVHAGDPYGSHQKIATIRGAGLSAINTPNWSVFINNPDEPALDAAFGSAGTGDLWTGNLAALEAELINLGYVIPSGWYVYARVREDASPIFGFDDFIIF